MSNTILEHVGPRTFQHVLDAVLADETKKNLLETFLYALDCVDSDKVVAFLKASALTEEDIEEVGATFPRPTMIVTEDSISHDFRLKFNGKDSGSLNLDGIEW